MNALPTDWVLGIETKVLTAIVSLLGLGGIWVIKQVSTWLTAKGIQIDTSNWNTALTNGLNAAIPFAVSEIQKNGWDHLPTQASIVTSAITKVITNNPDVVKAAGLVPDVNNTKTVAAVQSALQARLPAVLAAAAASPATPDQSLTTASIAAAKA